ncbi:MAG: arginase family protein [Candidatus Acidiferrales bacterium]
MAVRIVRQPKKIVLLGAPSSAAALSAGHERAPAALRAAGLVARLQSAGFEVLDAGDIATRVYQVDDEHPRARNFPAVLEVLHDLRPRVEVAIKSGALPLVIGGDCIVVLAILAGARRYYRNVGLVYMDSDADLNVPATSASGCVDGMVISHIVGRGAAEMVRFWGEPPLVREPDIMLFGVNRVDPNEEQFLARSPMPRHLADEISRRGGAVVAEEAAQRAHSAQREFVLHFDVDVISGREFPATNYPALEGISLADARQAFTVFARQPQLAGINVSAYNPDRDPDGSYGKILIDMIVDALEQRIVALTEKPAAPVVETAPAAVAVPAAEEPSAPVVSEESAPAESSEPAAETTVAEATHAEVTETTPENTSPDAPAAPEPTNSDPTSP